MARKTAPDIKVSARYVDDRKALSDKWDETEKDFVHIWQPGDISQEKLASKGMEVVTDGNGAKVQHGPDLLCRKDRKEYEEEFRAGTRDSEEMMIRLADGNKRKVIKFRNPVVPKGE